MMGKHLFELQRVFPKRRDYETRQRSAPLWIGVT
jgi:hypothetical protein